jgi:hypothetical protein
MTPRAPRICPEIGCSNLVPAGAKRCEEHYTPWAGKSFDPRRSDTAAHRRLKAQVLQRANFACEIADVGCLGTATEVDRVDRTLGYTLENTAACCHSCHAKKTGREGRAAQLGDDAPDPRGNATPPPRRTRERRRRAYDGVSIPRAIWTDRPS